jgi:hypothetical protein
VSSRKEISRREFLIDAAQIGGFASVVGGLGLIVGYAILEEEKRDKAPLGISLQELIDNPEAYVGKEISTHGYPKFVGDNSFYIGTPQFDMNGKLTVGFSRVRYTTHSLHVSNDETSDYFTVTEKTGGGFMPYQVITGARESRLSDTLYRVQGFVTADEQQKLHYLNVTVAEPVKPTSS